MSEARLKILNMVAEGKISAEEAVKLLNALRSSSEKAQASAGSASEPRFLRVRVTSSRTGKVKANINIPMSLVNVGLQMGARFTPDLEGLDFGEVISAIKRGARGKVVEMEDEESGELVEIFVD
ncbi:MAG: hypothetical protein QXP01_08215 [Candidatus Hadarchaeum sp.]